MKPGDRIRPAAPDPATDIWRGTVLAIVPDQEDSVRVQWDHTLFPSFHHPEELKEAT